MAMPEGPPGPAARWIGRIDLLAPPQSAPVPDMALGFVGVVTQGSVRFVYSVAIAALTTAAALGTVNSLLSVAMLASLLWPTAAGFAVSKYVAIGRSRGAAAEVLGIARHLGRTVVVASGGLSVLAAVVGRTVVDATIVETVVAAMLVGAYSLATYARGVLYGIGAIPRATSWDVITALVALIGLMSVLVLDVPIGLLLLPLTVCYACYVAANWPFGHLPGELPEDVRREIDTFVLYATLGSLAGSGLGQLAMVVVKSATAAPDAGYFAAALSLAAPAGLVANAVILVASPALADLHGRGEHGLALQQTDRGTRVLAITMFGLFGAVILASDPLVRLFYGAGFAEGGSILRVLLVAVLLPAIAAAATSSLLVKHGDGQRIFAWCNVGGLAVGSVAMGVLLAVWPHNPLVVAWGYLLGAAVVGLVPLGIIWHREQHRWLGIALFLLAGGGAILALRLAENLVDVGLWWDVPVAAGFAVTWLAVGRRDVPGLG